MIEQPETMFSLRREDVDGIPVVEVAGTLDITTVRDFRDALAQLDRAVLDFSALEFVDSSGLREVLDLRRRLGEHLRIVACDTGPFGRVLALTHLRTHFGVHRSRADAVAQLERGARGS
jgi:anti-anti-sigma factor